MAAAPDFAPARRLLAALLLQRGELGRAEQLVRPGDYLAAVLQQRLQRARMVVQDQTKIDFVQDHIGQNGSFQRVIQHMQQFDDRFQQLIAQRFGENGRSFWRLGRWRETAGRPITATRLRLSLPADSFPNQPLRHMNRPRHSCCGAS